ncbi:MAG: GntR family transcriptional regulator [Christensenella sp.]
MSKETLKRQIYNRILEEIINKKYPMDYILKEKELAEKFGISKAPVREALIELSMENIVKSIPRAGYMIVHFTEKDISEATDLRLMLEMPVLEAIIGNITPKALQSLKKQAEEGSFTRNKSAVSMDTWWNENIRFHVALNSIAGNSLLTSTLETVMKRLWRVFAQLFWSGNPQDYFVIEPESHMTLLKAIEDKDIEKARTLLLADILSVRKQFSLNDSRSNLNINV